MKLEVCCGSFADAYNAYIGGADRVELCSSLYLGGLTPTLGSFILTKEKTDLEIVCILRPRAGGFCYGENDIKIIFEDAKIFLEHGVDGLVFGFLTENHDLDIELTKKMIKLIKSYNKEAILHRCFDCVNYPEKVIERCIELGIDRILTSGYKESAFKGIDNIAYLQANYGDKIQILPGAGINQNNVLELIKKTNVSQIHSSCKGYELDNTNVGKNVKYSYLKDELAYEVVDADIVRKMKEIIK